jgi:hypothetical protein
MRCLADCVLMDSFSDAFGSRRNITLVLCDVLVKKEMGYQADFGVI